MICKKRISRLIAKSLLVPTTGSCFICCVSGMELKKEDELKTILEEAIMDLLKNKLEKLTTNTNKLKEKPDIFLMNTLKYNIINLSKSLFKILREYKYPTNYQYTIRQLLEYIKKNENDKSYYQEYSNQIKDQNSMRQMLAEIYSDSEDLVKKFDKLCELISNSIKLLYESNTNIIQILEIFGIQESNLLSSKSYLFPFI